MSGADGRDAGDGSEVAAFTGTATWDEVRAGVGVPTHDESFEELAGRQVALIDLLDRLLTGGAVLTGDLVLSVADVDLVHINLRAVIRSITPDEPGPW